MLPLKGLSLEKTQPPKVLAITAASFCMEPVATATLPVFVCNTECAHTALKSFLLLPSLDLCIVLSVLHANSLYDQGHGCFNKPLLALEEGLDSAWFLKLGFMVRACANHLTC